MQRIGWMRTDEFGWQVGISICSKHCQTRADKLCKQYANSHEIIFMWYVWTSTMLMSHVVMSLLQPASTMNQPNNGGHHHNTTHHPTTVHIRPPTTSLPYHFTQTQCQKQPCPPKKDDNHPTNAHDHLTMTTTPCTKHNHPKMTTSTYKKHQQPPPAHPTAPELWTNKQCGNTMTIFLSSSLFMFDTHIQVSKPTMSIIGHLTDATPPHWSPSGRLAPPTSPVEQPLQSPIFGYL